MFLIFALLFYIGHVLADDFCTKYGSPEMLDDLMIRTRSQIPSSFMLPDRVGLVGIYSANITNLNEFARSPERQTVCSGNTIEVPVIWLRKPTGRFMATGKHFKFVRKVYEVVIGILEAKFLIEIIPTEEGSAVATLKTLSVTRLSKIQVRAIGFGLIGKVLSALTTIVIRFFEVVFQAFMENNLKNEIENVMVHVPVGNFFPTFFWGDDDSEDDASERESSWENEESKQTSPNTNWKRPNAPRTETVDVDEAQENKDFEILETVTKQVTPTKKVDAEKDWEWTFDKNNVAPPKPEAEEKVIKTWLPFPEDVEVFSPKSDNEIEHEKPESEANGDRKHWGEMEDIDEGTTGEEKEKEKWDDYDERFSFEKLDPRSWKGFI